MDALSELRLDSAIFFKAEFSEPPILTSGTGHLIIYRPPARFRKDRTSQRAEVPAGGPCLA
jgi:hypothetical protein